MLYPRIHLKKPPDTVAEPPEMVNHLANAHRGMIRIGLIYPLHYFQIPLRLTTLGLVVVCATGQTKDFALLTYGKASLRGY